MAAKIATFCRFPKRVRLRFHCVQRVPARSVRTDFSFHCIAFDLMTRSLCICNAEVRAVGVFNLSVYDLTGIVCRIRSRLAVAITIAGQRLALDVEWRFEKKRVRTVKPNSSRAYGQKSNQRRQAAGE